MASNQATNVHTDTADQRENYELMLRAAGVEEVYSDTGYSPLPALDSPSSTELESPHEGTLPSQPTSTDQGGLHTSGGSRDYRPPPPALQMERTTGYEPNLPINRAVARPHGFIAPPSPRFIRQPYLLRGDPAPSETPTLGPNAIPEFALTPWTGHQDQHHQPQAFKRQEARSRTIL